MRTYNPFSLEKKTIFVTGASSGIGRAIAIECSKMGAQLIINGRNRDRLNDTFHNLEGTHHIQIIADLSIPEGMNKILNEIPSLDGIAHCAGVAGHLPFKFLKETNLREMFEINFFSPTILTSELLKAKKINKKSSLVFITSISGILSSHVGGTVYSATKGALNGLIKGMALDLAPKQIRVNSVMPAMVATHIFDNSSVDKEQLEHDAEMYPLKRYGKPEEIAYAAIYLLSDASAWTTGTNLLIDGGRTIRY